MENTDYVKLVVEAKDNKAALEKLLELFNKTIRSHAKKMFFMEQEDAIQELSLALIYAIKTIPKCENSGEVISYLLNAIHFKYCYFCKNYFKKNQYELHENLELFDGIPYFEKYFDIETITDLNSKKEKLTKRQKEILEFIIEGKSDREISNQLGISRQYVNRIKKTINIF